MFSVRQELGIKCLKWELTAATQCEAVFLGGIRTDTQSGCQAMETLSSSLLLCLTTRLERTVYCDPHLPEKLLTCDSVYKQHPLTPGSINVTTPICWPRHCGHKNRQDGQAALQAYGESQHLLAEPVPSVKAKPVRAAPLIFMWSLLVSRIPSLGQRLLKLNSSFQNTQWRHLKYILWP